MVCELLVATPEIREMIESGASPSLIARKGIREDATLRSNALRLLAQGVTSLSEVNRVTLKE
jgi:type II secretory ATPase GspE/PulE/Tfp pilus assembly ATPase PilB-like protein